MANSKRDPYYYRNFPSNANPERTPFSRSGEKDKGHFFIYMTNSKGWSLLLERARLNHIGEEAEQQIPMGYNQFWLFEKIFSTKRLRKKQVIDKSVMDFHFNKAYPTEIERKDWPNRLYVVFREPYFFPVLEGDVLAYYLDKTEAIDAAAVYTLQKNRRAVVGLLQRELMWH